MENLLAHIKLYISISDDLEQAIKENFQQEVFSKNETILREAQYCRKLYFLEKGLVRTFFYHKLKDVSTFFYHENTLFTSAYSFYQQQASYEYIEALEPTTVYSISYDKYQQLTTQFHEFEHFGRIYAERQVAYIDFYNKGYAFMTAKEKYHLLLEMFPSIELRVKLGYIASFLGVSQETLSRLRKQKN